MRFHPEMPLANKPNQTLSQPAPVPFTRCGSQAARTYCGFHVLQSVASPVPNLSSSLVAQLPQRVLHVLDGSYRKLNLDFW